MRNRTLITTANRIITSIVSIILIIINYLLSTVSVGQAGFVIMTVFGLIVFAWILITWKVITNEVLSTYFIFMACSLLFYWGQPLAYLLGADLNNIDVYSISLFSQEECIKTMNYILTGYLLMHIGAISFANREDTCIDTNSKVYDYSREMNVIGKALVIVSIVPQIILIYGSVLAVMKYGYIGLFMESRTIAVNGGLIGILSGFFIPGLFMLIIANAEYYRIAKKYALVCLIYIGIVFLLGRRGENSIYLIALILIWHKKVKAIERKNIFKMAAVGLLLVFVIYMVTNVRVYLNNGSVNDVIKNTIKDFNIIDMITGLLAEFGMTLLIPIIIMTNVPATIPFYKGKTYLNFILILIPNIFWETNPGLVDGTLESIVSPFVRNGSVGGIGGSFMAELYYNFGYVSYIFFPIIGSLLYKLNYPIDDKLGKNSKLKFFILIYVFTNVLWVIRGEVMTNGKDIVYFALFPAFLVWAMRHTRKTF